MYHKKSNNLIKNKNCITFVDPKNKPEFYKHAFLVKPNMEKFVEWWENLINKKHLILLKK